MADKFGKLIGIVYRKWKASGADKLHPDEETMVSFLEGNLKQKESEEFKQHLLKCARCSEILGAQLKIGDLKDRDVPEWLVEKVKDLVGMEDSRGILEIALRLKENTVELLNAVGDILVGQELIPVPVLRSRKIKDFKDEIIILKDFKDMRVEIKVENKQAKAFNLSVVAKEKTTQHVFKDLRISLLKDDMELESYLADSGRVNFDNVLLGKYIIEINTPQEKAASILLDIKA